MKTKSLTIKFNFHFFSLTYVRPTSITHYINRIQNKSDLYIYTYIYLNLCFALFINYNIVLKSPKNILMTFCFGYILLHIYIALKNGLFVRISVIEMYIYNMIHLVQAYLRMFK